MHVWRRGQPDDDRPVVSQTRARRFAELYQANYPRLVDYGRRRVRADEVDDLVAEVFLIAWRRIDDAPPGNRALPWLYRIAYHRIGNHWRGRDRQRRLVRRLATVRPTTPSPIPGPEGVDGGQRADRILEAAARLRSTDAEVLRLAHWEELTVAEIAHVLGIAPNSAKQRLRRARRRLKREYEATLDPQGTTRPVPAEGGAA